MLAIKPKIGTLFVVPDRNNPDDGLRSDPINDLIGKTVKVCTAKVLRYDLICLWGSQYSQDFRFEVIDEITGHFNPGHALVIVQCPLNIAACSRRKNGPNHLMCSLNEVKNSSCVITVSGSVSISRSRRRASSTQSSSSSTNGEGNDTISFSASFALSANGKLRASCSASAATDIWFDLNVILPPNGLASRHASRPSDYIAVSILDYRTVFNAWPVKDFLILATSSGVPVATTRPPPEPPSGPRSMM